MKVRASSPLCFGVFEFNSESNELRKQGLKIKLGPQAGKVLALLLERPGQPRTREELRRAMWPADTFVDFEHSLNKAIYVLRGALGDSATTPRYIETVAGQGYRFIPIMQEPKQPIVNAKDTRRSDSLAVLSLRNESADAELSFLGLRVVARVIDALAEIPGIRVLAYNTVQHYQARDRSPQHIAKELGVTRLLLGELVRRGADLFLHVELIDAADGALLWGLQLKQADAQAPDCVEQLARKICQPLRAVLAHGGKRFRIRAERPAPSNHRRHGNILKMRPSRPTLAKRAMDLSS